MFLLRLRGGVGGRLLRRFDWLLLDRAKRLFSSLLKLRSRSLDPDALDADDVLRSSTVGLRPELGDVLLSYSWAAPLT